MKRLLCPYCAALLPDILVCCGSQEGSFEHFIPNAGPERFRCEAQRFRRARLPPEETEK